MISLDFEFELPGILERSEFSILGGRHLISKVGQYELVNHCGQERLERIDCSHDPRRQAVEQV